MGSVAYPGQAADLPVSRQLEQMHCRQQRQEDVAHRALPAPPRSPDATLREFNSAGRLVRLDAQVAALGGCAGSIVVIQEVTPSTAPLWQAALHRQGLEYSLCTVPESTPGPKYLQLGVLVASRCRIVDLLPCPHDMPWPQRSLSVVIETNVGAITVHAVHMPTGVGHRAEKIASFHAVYRMIDTPSDKPRVLCGDFNSPKFEFADGTIHTWGNKQQQAAEYLLFGASRHMLRDVFRGLHGYHTPAWSWCRQIRGKPVMRRFDHIFASPELKASACGYLHDFVTMGLSDHAPIVADFNQY